MHRHRSTGDIVPDHRGSGYFGLPALVETNLIIYRRMREVIISLKPPTAVSLSMEKEALFTEVKCFE